jgi:glycosyltransferase involved in cell wall biosynthesis
MMASSPAATLRTLRRHNGWFDGLEPADQTDRPVAVSVSGYLRDESGWGAAARGYIRALQHGGVPTSLEDFSPLTSNRSEDHSGGTGQRLPFADVNLVCIDAGQHYAVLSQAGEDFFDGRYNIGAWAWELPQFPNRWYDRFAYYDEIWAGSSFIASTLSPIAPIPVVRIPPVMTPATYGSRERGRIEWGIAPDEFVFLFVFDVHSHRARKNPLGVVNAFRRAFRPSERVRLILKCVNGESDPSGYAALKGAAAGASITFANGYTPASRLRDLVAASDAYVSLHRSEGIGLTIADAMAHGKPVIATGWSGNVDFMDVSNSYPVSYQLAELNENVGPYSAGSRWAQPSCEHAAELMREVVDNYEDALARGAAARENIQRNYSERAIAALVRHRLDIISQRDQFGAFRQGVKALTEGYRDLVDQIREIVARVVPRDGVVMVVSKGDNSFSSFDGRSGCHFPETSSGLYAGFHPRDSDAAIELLEASIAKGRQYLLFPGTALWWFDHYAGFRSYLETRYRRVWDDARCVLYDVRVADPAAGPA